MPCCLAFLGVMFPRFGSVLLWIARPQLFMGAFNDRWILAILGIVFLPFTTLLYVILYAPGFSSAGFGLQGWDWLWIAMAVVVDIMHLGTQTYQNREQIPGYTSRFGDRRMV